MSPHLNPKHVTARLQGNLNHLKGAAAEDQVAELYLARGATLIAKRWRGPSGEIDLIFDTPDQVLFVEVKTGATFDQAMANLSQRQINRLFRAGAEFTDTLPKGSLTEVRFDLALVNRAGQIKIMENALFG